MAGKIGRMDIYDNNVETWDSYSERLEQYFICNDVKAEKKVPALLSLVGGTTYALLRGLTAPKKPSEETYNNLVKTLKDHLSPKPLVIAERFRFHKREQREGETIREYIAAIRKLAEYCDFGDTLNDSLRDRLVCGLRSEHIQKKLLSEATLELKTAVDISLAMETAARDAVELQSKHQSTGVHKLQAKKYAPAKREKPRRTNSSHTNKQYAGKNKQSKCFRCNGAGHYPDDCYFKDKLCFACNQTGHCKKACRKERGNRVHMVDENDNDYDYIASLEINTVEKSRQGVISIMPKVNGVAVEMELDTGAAVSVMTEKMYRKHFPGQLENLEPSDVCLKTYSGEKLQPLGVAHVQVEYKKQCKQLKLYIVQKGGPTLFGRDWLQQITLDWPTIKAVSTEPQHERNHVNKEPVATPVQLQTILGKYKAVFGNDLGTVKEIKAKLNLKSDATPKFCKARPVPYAIRPKVQAEIDNLVENGVLTKVNYSEWATPIVPVIKKTGKVRLCGDFKVTLNPVLEIDQYPLPRIEDIFAALAGGKRFSKLDLRQAYLQMEVDEDSRSLLTINTEKGLYQYNRLVYGVASAPAIWQRTMDTILQGLPGVKCIIDDMIITGKTPIEHLNNLDAVLERLHKYGLRANLDKCEFFQERISFCGHEIDIEGLHKTQEKIEAVINAPKPTSTTELRSFLGIVNYYNRFLKNLSATLHPLHKLLEKNCNWEWSKECSDAFEEVKQMITSNEVLTHYDPDLPLRLASDASPKGLGAVLSHVMPDGTERPIAYASRSLNKAEQNYAQIDKEALGIVWSVKRFHTYLFGRHFTMITDHQPLVSIFNPQKGISTTSAARLQRYALFLAGYDYAIQYKNTKRHGNADCLSRLPLKDTGRESEVIELDAVEVLNLSQFDTLPVNHDQVRRETVRDPTTSSIYECVMSGWNPDIRSADTEAYFARKNELTVQHGCLLWGIRVIIPPKLRNRVLQELHTGHIGVVKMKALARSYTWWPGIDKDIDTITKSCKGCQEVRSAPPAAPIHPWEWPSQPWSRIHIDFAGPFLGSMFFVVVDANSKWPEVVQMSTTTSEKTIEVLRTIFARNGIPKQVVSDNGPQFVSEEFRNFVKTNGIRHITSAPYHPSTNGLAERFVQSFKMAMRSSTKDPGSINKKLSNFLMAYRNAPHTTTNETPAKLFMGRNLCTRMDLVKPNIQRHVEDVQSKMLEKRHVAQRSFEPGQTVAIRDYRGNKPSWTSGSVSSQTGPVSYRVEVAPGVFWRRHLDQLRDSNIAPTNSENESTVERFPSNKGHAVTSVVDPTQSSECEKPTTNISDTGQNLPVKQCPVNIPVRRNPKRHASTPKRYDDFVKE